ncbi:DUF4297 domain-containing protein [Clostridium intestinale]|uniref:DUF4297 domain-containing protein n=1 Tax=Clostridium intestinale TaxID=36845 RepID=A0A7D6ZJ64_9CLOT|nr:DUF4297 domain-containing protein [Clostridium intestinale]QLY81901.1 DUF4297 domain-containing protein [Clostridium intestinale]
MSLKEELISKKPREKDGSRSSGRFDYQKDWALCKLLELHQHNDDYLLAFDFHDDIIVIDSEKNPNLIEFYQIKTKTSGNWTTTSLIQSKKSKTEKTLSIMGKIYDNKISFPKNTKSLNFISNATFSMALNKDEEKSIDKKEICLSDLSQKEIKKIVDKIKSEHTLTEEPDLHNITFFKVSDLSLTDHENHTIGKLSKFLENLYSDKNFRVGVIYRTLFDEIKRKNNYAFDIDKYDDLVEHKSIGQNQFTNMLNIILPKINLESTWNNIEQRLNTEKLSILEIKKISRSWLKYQVERMNLGSDTLQNIRIEITKIISKSESTTYSKLMQESLDIFYSTYDGDYSLYDEYYLKAIILMEFCEL